MNTCVYSSLVFITNVVAAYLTGEYIYATAFLALTCSSVALHSSRDTSFYRVLYWIDQVCMYAVIFCGACIFYFNVWSYGQKPIWPAYMSSSISVAEGQQKIRLDIKPWSVTACIAIACFFADIYLYYLSDTSEEIDKWHSILHYISSIGHHCLLL
jgi:hypothetical protein